MQQTCTQACNDDGLACNENAFDEVDAEDINEIFEDLDFQCSSTNADDHGQGFSICTGQDCCGGNCVNDCSIPFGGRTCDASTFGSHQRLCPCEIGTNFLIC